MSTPFPTLFDPDANDRPIAPVVPPPVNHFVVVRTKFPRIAESIRLLWGTPELQKYLADLIIDDQHYDTGSSRQGFPQDVMASLLVIYNKHSAGAPITDIWHNAR